ncbi:MutS-related protein [Haloimpatiens lingqiaonensis]|uniref:MutS-related protein n=1 Tax=Haloimpatiens lingqiaonensis TaxID=1380675 RepID=UPI0010FD2078|nr:MutS family DNA mismatch repair protein [Haloimpatiens lingqiaonensis]
MVNGTNKGTKENVFRLLSMISIILGIVIGYTSIINIGINKLYAIGIILSVVLICLGIYFCLKMKSYKRIRELSNNWGNEVNKKRKFEHIRKLHDVLKSKEEFYVDEQTWLDLDMDKVFLKLDRTLSTPGEQYLYHMLRKPCFSQDKLKRTGEKIEYFTTNKDTRDKIRFFLDKLGRDRKATLVEFLNGEFQYSKVLKVVLNLLALLALIAVIYAVEKNPSIGVLEVFGIYFINLSIHSRVKRRIGADTSCIKYMYRVLAAAKNISSLNNCSKNIEEINVLKEEMGKCNKLIKSSASIAMAGTEGVDVFLDYINIFFLMEIRSYFSVVKEVEKQRESIKRIYENIGKIDALISVASYREGLKEYTEPVFVNNDNKLLLKEVSHPLIENPVCNSLNMDNNIIITGSNMSGKSTFLRTVGINALFAQTIYTCICKEYRGSFFRVITSISVNDNITEGKSYYLGEAEALQRIINSSGFDKYPILTLIDEIFRGTNPVERVNAAAEILDYLAKNNCLVMVATHDLEITNMVKETYYNYYFTENVTKEGLNFEYKIREGISPTRNAIKILEYLGYPDEIINNINKRIEHKEDNINLGL